jgi:hypothetical protein
MASWLRALAMASAIAVQAGLAGAAPEVGWWWNPDESGRGYFIESQDGIFFMAAYFYADDGRARWLIAGDANADPYNFSGRLSEVSNGQTLYGPYVPPTTLVDAGAVSVSFSDDIHGTIVWPGGTVPIVRDIFDPGTASFQPESGWWWDPNQSGSGYSIEVQGNSLFIVGFMYDDAGNPVWYLSAGPMSTPTTYHGNLLFIAGGQTESGPYHPPATATTIGTVDLNFSAVDQATLTFTEASAARATSVWPLAGRSSTRNLQRQYKHPKYVLPNTYKGSYNVTATSHTDAGMGVAHIDQTYLMNFSGMTWTLSDLSTLNGQHAYTLTSGSLSVDFSSIEDAAPGVCTASATLNLDLKTLPQSNFSLSVSDSGRYTLSMVLNPGDVTATAPVTCSFPSPPASLPVFPTFSSNSFEGTISGTEFKSGGIRTEIDPGTRVTVQFGFDFVAGP